MAKSEFLLAFNEIAELRKLPRDVISDALRQALISAYRRDMRASNAQRIEAEVDLISNVHKILVEKEVIEDVRTTIPRCRSKKHASSNQTSSLATC